jgi:hypothetical protein
VVKTIIITHTPKAPIKSGVAGKPEFKRILKKKKSLNSIGTIGLSSHNFPAVTFG